MMRPSDQLPEIYLCIQPVDFRKGINGLAILVEEQLELSPFSEHLFVFTNRLKDKVKILYWEKSGFCLWMKRLEKERFKWSTEQGDLTTITGQQLNWLLDGYDLRYLKPHNVLEYQSLL
ncbi:MAG: IS66 family insertion sequence element accessory protein TnpB [Gammaproteobacteria bacterium]|nr:IS66 family insertion sequence element accessory protein TnpB [Gammaproteobacteria bacterium]